MSKMEIFKDELILEAEVTLGDPKDLKKDLKELMINFEDDLIREEFSEAMKTPDSLKENSQRLNDLIKRRSDLEKRKQNL